MEARKSRDATYARYLEQKLVIKRENGAKLQKAIEKVRKTVKNSKLAVFSLSRPTFLIKQSRPTLLIKQLVKTKISVKTIGQDQHLS